MGNQAYAFTPAAAAAADPSIWPILYECPVYKIHVPAAMIDYYLPRRLLAYAKNTRMNIENRFYFLSEQGSMVTRSPFDDYIDQLPYSMSFDYFLHQVSREKDRTVRYNLVIADNYLIFIRAPHYLDRSSRLLCKHITIASRAPYARYAGEIWYDKRGSFMVNNSSGTYQPPDRLIMPVIRILRQLSPHTHFRGISFRTSASPFSNKQS